MPFTWDEDKRQMSDFIDPDDAPPVTQADLDRAVFRVGGKPVERGKVPVRMMLDAGIVQFFKNQAGSRGFHGLINEALNEYIRNHGRASPGHP